jgi:hypothetical protein
MVIFENANDFRYHRLHHVILVPSHVHQVPQGMEAVVAGPGVINGSLGSISWSQFEGLGDDFIMKNSRETLEMGNVS